MTLTHPSLHASADGLTQPARIVIYRLERVTVPIRSWGAAMTRGEGYRTAEALETHYVDLQTNPYPWKLVQLADAYAGQAYRGTITKAYLEDDVA